MEAIIWGGGKIGRGFVAEIFSQGGFDLTFVDAAEELIDALRREGEYTVVKAPTGKEPELVRIDRFNALHLSERARIDALVSRVSYIAVVLFPDAFESFADEVARGIELRIDNRGAERGPVPLDLILCANISGAAARLEPLIRERLSEPAARYFDEKVGVVETVTIRIGVPTPERFSHHGPLTVVTNGFSYMPVNRDAFRGTIPDLPMLRPIENIEAEETRKYFTYNMVHAVYAYAGFMFGYEGVLEAASDPLIEREAEGALLEASRALEAEYGFTPAEMERWRGEVFSNLKNPLIEDTLVRVGRDPKRKLGRSERLIGPALLCKKHGIFPHFLTKAIARSLFFEPPGDPGAEEVQALLRKDGVFGALSILGGLDRDPEIAYFAKRMVDHLSADPRYVASEGRLELLRQAYEKGFRYEAEYHGCAQCTLATLFDLEGEKSEELFQAASGMSGGVGLCGDAACGGYLAGVLWTGHHVGRRLSAFDGDKDRQYQAYTMAQRLHDRFLETYGSVNCAAIHDSIFGRPYTLRTKPVRREFEAAGAHADRCTSVVAMAAMWTTEILLEEGLFYDEPV